MRTTLETVTQMPHCPNRWWNKWQNNRETWAKLRVVRPPHRWQHAKFCKLSRLVDLFPHEWLLRRDFPVLERNVIRFCSIVRELLNCALTFVDEPLNALNVDE